METHRSCDSQGMSPRSYLDPQGMGSARTSPLLMVTDRQAFILTATSHRFVLRLPWLNISDASVDGWDGNLRSTEDICMNVLFQLLCKQSNASEDQFAASCPSLRPPRCQTIMGLVFTYQEIDTEMCLDRIDDTC
jgi:hypothetical protein